MSQIGNLVNFQFSIGNSPKNTFGKVTNLQFLKAKLGNVTNWPWELIVSEFAINKWIILRKVNLEKSQICYSEMISFPKNGIRKSPKERTQ